MAPAKKLRMAALSRLLPCSVNTSIFGELPETERFGQQMPLSRRNQTYTWRQP